MRIDVRFRRRGRSGALREHVGRRAHVQLSRFNGAVSSVVVSIADIDDPEEGVDARCRVTVRGPALGSVTVEDLGTDAYAAVDIALERAARAVGRAIERARGRRRPDGVLGRTS